MALLISDDGLRVIDEEIVREERRARPDCICFQTYRHLTQELAYLTRAIVKAHQTSPRSQAAGTPVGIIHSDISDTQTVHFILSKEGVIANYNPRARQIPINEFERESRNNKMPIPFAARSGMISSIDALLIPQMLREDRNMADRLWKAFPEYQEPVEALLRELSLLVGLSLEVLDYQAVLKKQEAIRNIIANPSGLTIPREGILVGFYSDSEYVAEFQQLAPEYVQKMPVRLYSEGLRVVMPCIERTSSGLYHVRTRIVAAEEYVETKKKQYQMLRERIPRGLAAGIRELLAKERACGTAQLPDFAEHLFSAGYTNLRRYFERHRIDAQRAVVNI